MTTTMIPSDTTTTTTKSRRRAATNTPAKVTTTTTTQEAAGEKRRRPSELSDAALAAFGEAMDRIRQEVLDSLGDQDAAYIRKVIAAQRRLEAAGRLALFAGIFPPAWILGTTMLGTAKILENMEIGHNVLHGQWDWMRDPDIHSSTWEWDTACPSDQWQHSHNNLHHTWTNVLGKDRDVGYGVLRMDESQRWSPVALGQPIYAALLATFFQWGVALHDVEVERVLKGRKDPAEAKAQLLGLWRKARKQVGKDYVLFPALAGPFFLPVVAGNAVANLARNLWSFTIIFCGHFPDGAQTFTQEEIEEEGRGGWYVRQILGSANLEGSSLMHLMSGNLSHQIEHHAFPDLPSNRYREVAPRVRALCEQYGLPYNSGSLPRQFGTVVRRICRLALPNRD
ncbi:MAG: fatty acid desaturase [Acidimicrobiales bacterium]|nr:fatty acid desaturase [Acidimicrobiales bacterium]